MALRDFNRTVMLPMRVWDAPIRLFHWATVLLFAALYITSQLRWIGWHLILGYVLLALLLFRLAWGVVGSETARFRHFLVSPVRGLQYLRGWFGERAPDTQVGHNEAGGWMVLLLLALLAAQLVTGLFSGGRVHRGEPGPAVAGPFAGYLDSATQQLMRAVHEDIIWNLLLVAIGLHLLAVAAYLVVKKHDLIRPMLTGVKRLPAATRQPRMASPGLAIAVLAASGAVVWLAVALG